VEWLLLEALRVIQDPERGEAVYLRLSTKTVDQALLQPALDRLGAEALHAQVLRGGYRLIDRSAEPDYEPGANVVTLVAAGVMVPEAVEASRQLAADGFHANVVALTSPRACYAEWRRQVDALVQGRAPAPMWVRELFPAEELEGEVPVVSVLDGTPTRSRGWGPCWAFPTRRWASTPSVSPEPAPISTVTTASTPTPSHERHASSWRSSALRSFVRLDSLRAPGSSRENPATVAPTGQKRSCTVSARGGRAARRPAPRRRDTWHCSDSSPARTNRFRSPSPFRDPSPDSSRHRRRSSRRPPP
jgi:hypothetical protein